MFAAELRGHIEAVSDLVGGLRPECLSGEDAGELCALFVRLERVGLAGVALCGHRAAETGLPGATGARDAPGWLARMSGTSRTSAASLLDAASALGERPSLRQALIAGDLSGAALRTIAARPLDEDTSATLVAVAQQASLGTLRAQAERLEHLALGEDGVEAQDRYAHDHRHLRWQSDPRGGVRGTFSLTDADWARCLPSIEARARTLFEEARSAGTFDSIHEYHADALVGLLSSANPSGEGPRASRAVLRVDVGALSRGALGPDEVCEVAGVGTISVSSARRLLGDSIFHVVVTKGTDVLSVTRATRTIPMTLRVALMERDPVCVVPGCAAALGLEIHHWRVDYALGGRTELANLARICKPHHDLHTYKGWRLGGGPGHWAWGPGDLRRRAGPTLVLTA